MASQVALVIKNPPAKAGDIRDVGSIPESGRFPGGGNDNPLQYSCLGDSMDRGAWQPTVHSVTKSHTRLKRLSMYACMVTQLSCQQGCHEIQKSTDAVNGGMGKCQ